MHESERIFEVNRYAEQSRNYRLYLELIDQYLASEEGIANVSKTGDNMADNDKMQLTNKYFQLTYHHLSARMMQMTGAPNENIVPNHLNIALLNVF